MGRVDPTANLAPKSTAEEWESRPGGLWLLRSTNKHHESDSHRAITAVDVLYGPDAIDPRPGWRMRDTPLLIDSPSKGLEAHITVRTGPPHKLEKHTPRIRRDGKYKIMQASDLHLATGLGVCRDALPADVPCDDADTRTLEFVSRLLDAEKPDLVILSGDQINGGTAPDTQSALLKLVDLFIKRSIPYAAIFGNHDDEKPTLLTRDASMAILETLPFSLSAPGPATLPGSGNYVLEVLAPGSSTHAALSLYLMDTHSGSPSERAFPGYAWLEPPQIQWFRSTAQALAPRHASYAKIHLSMAFVHIPLSEYRDEANPIAGGVWREPVTAPLWNSGAGAALAAEGVLAVGCGHDHVNDYCAFTRPSVKAGEDGEVLDPEKDEPAGKAGKLKEDPAIWMCYAGGGGFGGYAGYGGYHRRIRFWEIDTNSAQITTWKRVEWGNTEERVDELLIVDGGKVVSS